jgi:hypothetical protein
MLQELLKLLEKKATATTCLEEAEAMGLPRPESDSFEDRKYLSFPSRGISLVFDSEILTAVQLFAAGEEPGFSAYVDDLPDGVLFSWKKELALKSLGVPEKAGGGSGSRFDQKPVPPWVRFQKGTYMLHLQFSHGEDRITRISMMRTLR